ncbi:transporter substrate-binding domain-containing protein [Marinobacter sp. 1-4A]|uniref:transporter substrate-binding domain-containing protein n=1 Tax=Marinobacter sp. 1-4A TaxID=2582919 RepID=UPI002234C713|nr:transporter substrate-binding domain-containing protein [Marinobacter sp. 1-4A]
MKTLLLNTFLTIALITSAPLLAQDKPLRVGMSGQYFPFTFVEQDQLKGFEVDVMNAVGKEMGRDIQYETANFSGLFGMLQSERIDTVANQITITDERKKAYVFSDPYVYDGAQVVTKEGNTEVRRVEDLKGKTVAVNLGSNFEALLKELPMRTRSPLKPMRAIWNETPLLGVWTHL